jgi:hypothetical protein
MVPRHFVVASASLALLTLSAACGGNSATASPTSPAPAATPTCVNAKAAHRAYVVVQHGTGSVVQRCVGFDAVSLTGDELMKQSGLTVQTQTFSGVGLAYCAIDNEPAQFDKCFPSTGPTWSLFTSKGGTAFQPAQTAAGAVTIQDRDALGWKYAAYSPSASPPPLPSPK